MNRNIRLWYWWSNKTLSWASSSSTRSPHQAAASHSERVSSVPSLFTKYIHFRIYRQKIAQFWGSILWRPTRQGLFRGQLDIIWPMTATAPPAAPTPRAGPKNPMPPNVHTCLRLCLLICTFAQLISAFVCEGSIRLTNAWSCKYSGAADDDWIRIYPTTIVGTGHVVSFSILKVSRSSNKYRKLVNVPCTSRCCRRSPPSPPAYTCPMEYSVRSLCSCGFQNHTVLVLLLVEMKVILNWLFR